ncbi:MAG TPA: multiheme c-type cytochrome [Polyangiaceae bacterium]|nr:multiheme c-type cytochrome [Polyangiaceae bacterium]
MARVLCAWLLAGLLLGCGNGPSDDPPKFTLTRAQLLDPQSCQPCHAEQYREWSGSMHAYASEDPLFLAMNQRGQREAQLGDFCVECHAPVATREGQTSDGLNLADLPSAVKGVTCFFCHSVDRVQGSHDNPLHLATDGVLRAELTDPAHNLAHDSSYSPLHDRNQLESSQLCGTCHDIVNGHGVNLERTFAEWQESVFSQAPGGSTCGQCHMDQSSSLQPAASVPGAPLRRTHAHALPGVDLASSDFPEADAQKALVQGALDSTLQSALCVRGVGTAQTLLVVLDNVAAGHAFPSGATQDRRAWVELNAYRAGTLIYRSGAPTADGSTPSDADLWLLRDCIRDSEQQPARMFWQAASSVPNLLPGQLTFDPSDPRFYQSHVFRRYPQTGVLTDAPDRVTLQVHLAAVAPEVIADLIGTGDLDPSFQGRIPKLLVGGPLEWTAAGATEHYTDQGLPTACVSQGGLRAAADKIPAGSPDCKN